MAKILKTSYDEKPVAPEGAYRATLAKVISKDMPSVYNGVTKVVPRFIFVFALSEFKGYGKDGKPYWRDIASKDLEVIKMTNQAYGNPQASLSEFLPMLLASRQTAETFFNEVGDTDALLGWRGELLVTHTVSDKVYANVTTVTPSDDWLGVWLSDMTGDPKYLVKPDSNPTPAYRPQAATGEVNGFTDPFADEDEGSLQTHSE